MSEVIALGYVGLTATDLAAFGEFSDTVLGLQRVPMVGKEPKSSPDRLLLRVDERAWRISVEQGPGGISYAGWEVASPIELNQLAGRLEALGIPVKEDADLAKERGVNGLLVSQDPDGNQVEFFYGAKVSRAPFVSPLGRRFVTGVKTPGDMGLGHIGMMFTDHAGAKKFYMDILGFKLSDTIFGSPFVHVNPRHHSLVIGPALAGVRKQGLHHLMLEVDDLDMVGYALDEVQRRSTEPITLTLGKHTNDRMTSFYLTTPGGFDMEYGYGGVHIDDSVWTTASYDAISFWGHRGGPVSND